MGVRYPEIVADIAAEKIQKFENWFDVFNVTRRALIRAGLRDEALDFDTEASVIVGRAIVENENTYRAMLVVASRWVVLELPATWEHP